MSGNDGFRSPAGQRETISVKEAAELLGCTTGRVHQLLRSDSEPLDSPGRPGRGRGHLTKIYVDTVEAQRTRQLSRRRSRAGARHERTQGHRPAQPVDAGGSELTTTDLLWALQQLNAATDALHEAAAREAAVRQHHRAALDSMSKALAEQDEAAAAIRRSDRLRSEVLGVLLTPPDLSGL